VFLNLIIKRNVNKMAPIAAESNKGTPMNESIVYNVFSCSIYDITTLSALSYDFNIEIFCRQVFKRCA